MATINRLGGAAQSDRILRARGVTRSFARGLARNRPGSFAIENIDLDIAGGDALGVIGEEGAGKTTLLQCLAGLLRRDAGTVDWFGERFPGGGGLPGLAYVPPMPVYYPFLTVRDVLEYRAARETVGRIRRQSIDSALELLGLIDKSSRHVVELSRDETRRLSIAEALSFDPTVVLVDTPPVDMAEPCSTHALRALREHADGGGAVVIASRDAQSVVRFLTRVVILADGRILRSFSADSPVDQGACVFPLPAAGSRFVAERIH
jgi:ABC-type multidrug transport system ATPase subunit